MSNDINVTIDLNNDPTNAWRDSIPPYPCKHVNGDHPYPWSPGNLNSTNINSLTVSGPGASVVTVTGTEIDIPDTAGLCNLYFSVTQGTTQFKVYWGLVLLDGDLGTVAGRWSWAGSSDAIPPSNLLVFNPSNTLSTNRNFEYYIVISRPNPDGSGATQYAVIDPKVTTNPN